MKRSELEIYQKIYIECHNLFITFAPREGTDENMQQFIDAAGISREKVKDHPFWFKMLLQTADEIEEVWKNRGGNEE